MTEFALTPKCVSVPATGKDSTVMSVSQQSETTCLSYVQVTNGAFLCFSVCQLVWK